MANGLIRQQSRASAIGMKRVKKEWPAVAKEATERRKRKALTKVSRERAALYRAKTREATERKKMVKVLHPTRYKIAHGKPFRKKALRRSLPKLKHGRRTVSGLMDYHL